MKLPLVVFSLLLCGLWLFQIISPGRRSDGLFWGAFRVWAFMAGAALLSIAFGKPGLFPQYAAWAVVLLSVGRAGSVLAEWSRLDRVLEVLSLVAIFYLWWHQLPIVGFNPF